MNFLPLYSEKKSEKEWLEKMREKIENENFWKISKNK